MDYSDSLWAHLGEINDSTDFEGEGTDDDVPTQEEVDAWLERVLDEGEERALDEGEADQSTLETTWNQAARRTAFRRTATGEPEVIESARRVLASSIFEVIDDLTITPHEAGAVLRVYDAASEWNQQRLAALGSERIVAIAKQYVAGAPTITSRESGPPPGTPQAEVDAYWSFVSQGAADSDSGWYVPLSFSSWRASYWKDDAGTTTYAPGLPPMASRRRTASSGFVEACRGVVASGSYTTFEGMLLDHFTASAVTQVYDALNDDNKAKLDAMSPEKAASVCFKLINKGSSKQAADEGGQKCKVCGSSIERDPEGEENRSWHHNDGESHDHEAEPESDSKESRVRRATQAPDGVSQERWDAAGKDAGLGVGHIWTNTSCPAYNTLDPADCTCNPKESRFRPVKMAGQFRITESTGSASGQPFYTLEYMADEDSWAYGVWDPVKSSSDRAELEAFIENPPDWWANPNTASKTAAGPRSAVAGDGAYVTDQYNSAIRHEVAPGTQAQGRLVGYTMFGESYAWTVDGLSGDMWNLGGRWNEITNTASKRTAATGSELRAAHPDLFSGADAAYDREDDGWFEALSNEDLLILWDSVSGNNFIDMEGPWDDEVYEALANRGHKFSAREAGRKKAISLTNVTLDGPGQAKGKDKDGNTVRFRLSDQDEKDLKFILLGDLAINFSGVDVDESDIIDEGTSA